MGVPSFFRWLSRTYPQVVLDAHPENKTDYLYIDFNALIHTASSPSDGPNQHSISGIMANLTKNIDKIVKTCRPHKMLYLSTDGVAPRTKMMHQRTRRYRSAHEKNEANKSSQIINASTSVENSTFLEPNDGTIALVDDEQIDSFDSNAITPGTQFMYEIEENIRSFIEDRLEKHPSYKELAVIYSTSRKPGEGEQKIMDFIRKIKNKNVKHTIYSPDADLIFLGASLHGRSIKIMREDLSFVNEQRTNLCNNCGKMGHLTDYCNNLVFNKFIYVDIEILRNILEEKIMFFLQDNTRDHGFGNRDRMGNASFNTNDFRNTNKSGNSRYFDKNSSSGRYNSGKNGSRYHDALSENTSNRRGIFQNFSINNMIDDWIFMSFLVGNDFLPTLQCFDIRFQAIEILFEFMIENYKQTKRFLTYNKKLQLDPLLNLFRIMSRQEDSLYSEKSRKLTNARRNFDSQGTFEKIDLNTRRGRSYFYLKKLNIKKRTEINKLCKEYIIGLSWVYDYYIQGIINWDWYFPYHYAPFLVDLANMSNETNQLSSAIFNHKAQRSYPLGCLEQQIFVLPPQSKHIAPKIMHDIFDTFPTEIKIDMFDKLLPWQGVVIVPMIDAEKLFLQIREKKNDLTHEEWSFFLESDDLLFVTRDTVLFKNKNHKNKHLKEQGKDTLNQEIEDKDSKNNKSSHQDSKKSSLFDKIKGMYDQDIPIIKHTTDFEMVLRPYHRYSMKNDQIVVCHIVV